MAQPSNTIDAVLKRKKNLDAQIAKLSNNVKDPLNLETLADVANVFGVAAHTVRGWRVESPPMPGKPGAFNIKDIIAWRFPRNALNRVANQESETAKQLDMEISRVKLERLRLDLERDKGQLLDRGDVTLWASTAMIEARVMVMSLPERLATSAPPEQRDFIRSESDRHCRDVLIMLRRRLETNKIDDDAATRSDEVSSAS